MSECQAKTADGSPAGNRLVPPKGERASRGLAHTGTFRVKQNEKKQQGVVDAPASRYFQRIKRREPRTP